MFSNRVPWLIIGICYVVCPMILLVIRALLARENKRRESEPHDDTYEDIWVQVADAEGKLVDRRVDKVGLFVCECIVQDAHVTVFRHSWI